MAMLHLHSHDCKGLEQERQCRFATCKPCIQKGDTGDDEPHEKGHHNEVKVVELESGVLSVDIFNIGVTTVGFRLVELGLEVCQSHSYYTKHTPLCIITLYAKGPHLLPRELPSCRKCSVQVQLEQQV